MHDDQRERNERREGPSGEAEQRELHRPLAEKGRRQRHGQELILNGFVTSLNGETLT